MSVSPSLSAKKLQKKLQKKLVSHDVRVDPVSKLQRSLHAVTMLCAV